MRVLLDTHIWLWMLTEPERLGGLKPLVEDTRNELLLSAASSWEIAIKYALGRLDLPDPPSSYVPRRTAESGVQRLNIEHEHTLAVAELPMIHRDPFDRLLIAQAKQLRIPLATVDDQLAGYEVDLLTP